MKFVKCNLCGQDKTKFLFYGQDRIYSTDNQNFSIVKCKNCGLVYLNPQPSTEELSQYYPDDYAAYQAPNGNKNIFLENHFYSFFRGIKRYLLPTKFNLKKKQQSLQIDSDTSIKRFLDFGCGSGKLLEEVRKKHPNWELYGLDVDERACSTTSKKGFRVYCGDVFNAKYDDNFFDVINTSQVLEHVPNPFQVLTELNRILKPNGLLQVDVPNFSSAAARVFKTYWINLDVPRHLYHFTPRVIKKMLIQTGFEVERITFKHGIYSEKSLPRSIDLFLHERITRLDPLLFHLLKPVERLLEKIRLSDIMYINARKQDD